MGSKRAGRIGDTLVILATSEEGIPGVWGQVGLFIRGDA